MTLISRRTKKILIAAYGVVPKMASGSFTWPLPRVNDKRTILKQPPEIRALFPIRLSLQFVALAIPNNYGSYSHAEWYLQLLCHVGWDRTQRNRTSRKRRGRGV